MADTIAEFIRQQNAARQKQTVGAASVVLASVEDQPDQVAGDLQLANEYGKLTGNPVPPAPMVKEYRGLFQAEIERKQASAWLNSAPTLAEFVRNPENAALVRDDLSALSAWDKMRKAAATGEAKLIEDSYEFRRDVDASLETSAFGRGMDAAGDAFDRAILTNADGTPNFLGRLANYAREKGTARDGVPRDIIGGAQVTPDERAAAMMAQGFGPIYDGAKAVIKQMEAEGFAPMNFKDVNGIGSALSFIGENLAMSAPQMATTIAAGPLGPVMSLMGMGGEANAELKERAADLPQDQRVAIATGAGTLMAALDLFGLSRIFGGVGAGQVATDAVAGTLADRVIANGGTQALGRVLTAAITEGSTESLQEAIVMGVTALAGGDYKQAEVIDRLAQAFFAGAGAGGAMRVGAEGAVGAGRAAERYTSDAQKIEGVEGTQARLQEIGQNAAISKLRERMPDRFRAFVSQALDGTQAENLYMPADAFVRYFQDMGVDPFEIADSLDGVTRDDLDAALAGGGMVKIPTATYAAHIAGTEHDAFFSENVKFDPNEFTADEARIANERIDQAMQEMFEEAEAARIEAEQWRTFEQQLTDDMVTRLRAAGQSADVARTNAATVVAAYQTEAARAGLTVDEFLNLWKLPDVQGSIPQGMQFRDVDEFARTIEAVRRRKAPEKDRRQSLLEFISERGGIVDQGGELKARDAAVIKRGRGKKTLRLAREGAADGQGSFGGMGATGGGSYGADSVAQAAIDAGFMADHPDVIAWKRAMEDGTEAPDITRALWDAIDAELRGERQTSAQDAAPDEDADGLDQIEDYLNRLGVNLDDDIEAIRAAVEGDRAEAARMYAQAADVNSPAFKEWFGQSKVVNPDGSPMVVYHGTNQQIEEFDVSRGGASTGDNAGATKAFFFTDNLEVAGQYAEQAGKRVIANVAAYEKESARLQKEAARLEKAANRTGDWDAYERAMEAWENHEANALYADDAEGQNTVEVYLSLQNPMVVDFEGGRLSADRDLDRLIDDAKAIGHDGLILRNLEDSPQMGIVSDQFVAFDPTQIKSVNNRGTWDASDPRILYQRDGGGAHPFEGFTREKFLGSPKITSDGNASTLVPTVLKGVREAEAVPFAAGNGLTARYDESGAAVFDGDQVVASYNFGDTLVVSKKYRRQGVASELVYQWRMRNPDSKPAKHRTKKSQAVQEQVWDRIRREIDADRTYNQADGGVRGSIQFGPDGQSVIRMFEAANLSTFQHEAGHLFLSIKQDLEARGFEHAAADMAIVRDWWRQNAADVARDGMRAAPDVTLTPADVNAWIDNGSTGDRAKDQAIDIGTQEQFARGWEAYLMEGRAPSVELKSVFAKMAAWLVSVYRKVRNLNVNLSDDIRSVMDRIVATDDQIARARAQQGDGGMVFATAEQLGLTQEEFDRLMKLRDQAEGEARGRLMAEIMEPIRREREEWYKAEKAKVREAVTADLRRRPVFRAIQELRFGKTFDGEPALSPELSRQDIERDYGAGIIPELPGSTKDGKGHRFAVFSNDGVHPDIVAGVYGFADGRALLDALATAPTIEDAIDAEVERVMSDIHGDALNDGEIEIIALDAVHSERRTEWLAAELKAISEVAGVALDLTAKEARIVARETLDRSTVKDAMAAQRFLAAERKAANEAQDIARALGREGVWMQNARRRIATKARGAVRGENTVDAVSRQAEQADASTGNYNETVQRFIAAKRRQLLNHALYMEARKTREMVEKVEAKAAKLNVSDEKLGKSRDIDYAKAARNLAAKFGLARADSEFDVQAWHDQLTHDDPVKANALQDAMDTYGRDAKPYKTMILSEFGALNDAIDSFLELGKQAKTIEIEGRLMDKQDAIDDLNEVLEGRGLKRNPALDRDLSDNEKRVRTFMGWASALRRVENWARAMDDGEQGVYTRYLVRPVMDALGAYRADKADKLREMLALVDGRRDALAGGEIHAPELNGYRFKNKAAVLHAILHTGNTSNFEKLLLGRGWSTGFINQTQALTKTGKPRFRRDGSPVMTRGELDTSQWDAFLNRVIAQGIITPDDIKTVNGIWDLMEKTKRPAQAAHKKMFGFYFKEIEAAGYDTAAGRLKGGYVPAILDRDASNDGMLRESETALDQQSAGFMLPTAGRGFTKSRVQNYTQPLALDLTLLPAHLDKVLRFTHLDPAVRQVHSLITDRRFGNTLSQYDPTLVDNMLIPWLQRVAQQSVDAPVPHMAGRDFNRVIAGLRKRVGFNTMFANVVNVVQQVTGLSVAATLVKGQHVRHATARFARDMAGSRQQVFDLSSYMRERVLNSTREMQGRIQDLVKTPTVYNDFQTWVERHGYFMQQGVQNWIDVPVWMAAFDQAVANGMTEKDAVFEADATIRRTMGGMNPEDVSLFESGNAFKRLFTMFYTYFNGQANHLAERGSVIFRQEGWGGSPKLFSLYLFGIMIPAVGAELIAQSFRGEAGDEEDDGYFDDILSLFFGSHFRYGTAMVPVAGQMMQLVFNQFNDKRYDDKLSPSPAISTLERAARAPFSVGSAVFGDGRADRAVGDGLTALALATGVPLNWLAKPMGYGAGVAEGRYTPDGPVDILQGLVSGRDGTDK